MNFRSMDIAGRLPRLRRRFEEAECEALLVTNLANIAYLTGFTGSAGLLLVLADSLVLATDGRYEQQSGEQLAAAGVDARFVIGQPPAQRDGLGAAAARAGVGRLGLEAGDVTWARQQAFAADWFADAELVATTGVVEELRRVKDPGEIDRMRAAAAIADAALAEVRPTIVEGMTEAALAMALDFAIRRAGATGNSFETIVASGPNGAKPHARPSKRPIRPGELVVIDFGAVVDGYCSDMTRTVCLGPPASATLARMVEVVAESQRAGVAAVRAGRPAVEIDEVCREVIAAAGWGDAFSHSTGHGVGLDIHEAPTLSRTTGDTLAAGHVVTVEPGVYLPEHGGVRIEDTVVVTENGCDLLTMSSKELVLA
ncbi:MAG: aminopeptidase P family protein [Acidimicrobiales bacterium]